GQGRGVAGRGGAWDRDVVAVPLEHHLRERQEGAVLEENAGVAQLEGRIGRARRRERRGKTAGDGYADRLERERLICRDGRVEANHAARQGAGREVGGIGLGGPRVVDLDVG